MRILVCHPGAQWSTSDVYDGLHYGLEQHGVEVIDYRLDGRIARAESWLGFNARKARKLHPEIQPPTRADVLYQASVGVLERALRFKVDLVLIVSALLIHPDVLVLMKRAGLRVAVLFTESPYDMDRETKIAGLVDGCWTNERATLSAFKAVNPNSGYIQHGWHPEKHRPDLPIIENTPAHDVVFVGSAFPERVAFFNAMDWTGIDFGLYGAWGKVKLTKQVAACVKAPIVTNAYASSLYRRAKIGINLHRTSLGFGPFVALPPGTAESLNPRAYELAACGVFHLSDYRPELRETFGALVPTFSTPTEAASLIRHWLSKPDERQEIAAHLPACVAGASWTERAATILGDVHTLLAQPALDAA